MNLQLHTLENRGTTVVMVAGEVELANVPQLRGELLRACDAGCPCVVVDLTHVTFIDSTGIGVLVGALKRARERGGELVLVCPQPRVRRIFEITGLMKVLPLFDTRDAALAACSAGTKSDGNHGGPKEA